MAEGSRLGIPVEPRTRSVPLKFENEPKETPEEPVQHIPVVGGRARLGAQPELARFAERLARQAEVEWLGTRFPHGRSGWAGSLPHLSPPQDAEAFPDVFTGLSSGASTPTNH